jgi:hypothetical protein
MLSLREKGGGTELQVKTCQKLSSRFGKSARCMTKHSEAFLWYHHYSFSMLAVCSRVGYPHCFPLSLHTASNTVVMRGVPYILPASQTTFGKTGVVLGTSAEQLPTLTAQESAAVVSFGRLRPAKTIPAIQAAGLGFVQLVVNSTLRVLRKAVFEQRALNMVVVCVCRRPPGGANRWVYWEPVMRPRLPTPLPRSPLLPPATHSACMEFQTAFPR